MLIDTHCHLDFKDFDGDRDRVIDRAREKGVARIINVASSVEGTRRSVELAERYDIVYASIGVHPHEAGSVAGSVIDEFKTLSKNPKVVAIGEVGLDYYRDLSPREDQIRSFETFILLAQDLNLPLIIHSREASDDTISILKKCSQLPTSNSQPIKGVMHCFSGDEKFLNECLGLGLHISFTCNLTFKNAEGLRRVAAKVPPERLLLETDAPFLAPQEFRGRRNEPSYLTCLVEELSKVTGLSKDDIERMTTHNANSLFGLGLDADGPKIAYRIRDSLYLNITNRCTNNCDFCVRSQTEFVKGHNLKLEREPSSEEVLKAIGDPGGHKEIVFCGYGEPTTRLDVVKAVAKAIKGYRPSTVDHRPKIRLVTNGHGDLINGRPIAKELAGLVDNVSVSLNTDREDLYNEVCKPAFGNDAYKAVVKFIKDCVETGIKAEVTCLNLPGVDLDKCAAIAGSLGASFRARRYGVTG